MSRLMSESDSRSLAITTGLLEPAVVSPYVVRAADVRELVKPRITYMVVLTAFVGFAMAARGATGLGFTAAIVTMWPTLLATLIGTALSCMGASAINQVIERHTDGLMTRTRQRPLPAGRIHPVTATALGLLLACMGVGLLWTAVNPMAAGLSAFTIVSYALIYTPMKRMSSMSTIVGAVPGALPPVIGAAGVSGVITIEAILLFSILFLWQLPHFLAIAWLHRDDYAAASIQVLPVEEPDGRSTFRQILIGCMALLPLGLLPTMFGVSGWLYFTVALLAGAAFLWAGVVLSFKRTRGHARLAFLVSLVYLPLVFIFMLVDQL